MSKLQCPEYYAEKARAAQVAGEWYQAAEFWHYAQTASSGHKRRARYEVLEEQCAAKAAGVEHGND